MENEKLDEIIKKKKDEFLSSETFHNKIKDYLDSNPPTFQVEAKGEEKADDLVKRIEASPLTELLQEYLDAVEEVKKKRKLSPENRLERLIPALSGIQKILFPNYPKYHQFVDETYIDLRKELDLDNLTWRPKRYFIHQTTEIKKLGHLNTRHKNIALRDQSLSATLSVSQIYKEFLPDLDQATMKSKDLLTQVLVCYTIKRALNGDEEAIERLYGLYEKAAENLAVRTARQFHLSSMKEEAKQDARALLRILIGGFKPETIFRQLLVKKGNGAINALPIWVKKFFVHYLSEYVPSKLKEIQKKSKVIDRIKGGSIDLGMELMTFLNPYAPIREATVWKGSPVRLNRFNSYSYHPLKMGPRRNLTTWLFGLTPKGPGRNLYRDPRGNLYRLLRDRLRPIARRKSKEESFDSMYDSKGFGVEGDPTKYRDKLIEKIIKKETIKKVSKELRKELVDIGVPARRATRNIGIYFDWKRDNFTQLEIARKHGISVRQIKRICQQIKRLLPKVKHLVLKKE